VRCEWRKCLESGGELECGWRDTDRCPLHLIRRALSVYRSRRASLKAAKVARLGPPGERYKLMQLLIRILRELREVEDLEGRRWRLVAVKGDGRRIYVFRRVDM